MATKQLPLGCAVLEVVVGCKCYIHLSCIVVVYDLSEVSHKAHRYIEPQPCRVWVHVLACLLVVLFIH